MTEYSILDYAVIDEGERAVEALAHTEELAQLAEKRGYKRFWVAEHHNIPAFASSSPEVIMMRLADQTQSIHIGSGGVMLPHYSPYKVAENFKVLAAYHPGRIDLGFGNNKSVPQIAKVMNEYQAGELSYEQAIKDLYKYMTDEDQADHRFNTLKANPSIEEALEMWILSSSVANAQLAGRLGLAYCFGIFPFARDNVLEIAEEAVAAYRASFKPSQATPAPRVMYAAFVAVAEQADHAEDLARALDWWLLGQDNFRYYDRFPSIASSQSFVATPEQSQAMKENRKRMITGDIDKVSAEIKDWNRRLAADEALLIPLVPGFDNRQISLEILADALID
ncbi:LLM class flavin-dependent oxidoreductase [Aerococcus sp. UMB9870]|uniref:LLM class flavin-dependent oxidoreductase n=1 Tax=Aerococcus sp. UMB9870 TaxID=3046351 RepID=UPI00254AFC7C|nr:LLM class flavin-dependent oxidoreductase [Aerococcus sp. UMB9870]MDK6368704.1 LLM class flavin-dependent oxidoreductase [Aerococcus sp. UMB9870]